MLRPHLVAAARAARRIFPSLGLAAVLLTSILGGPPPARAEEPTVRDHRAPAARVKIHFNYAYIIDDHDPYDGEMNFQFKMTCYATPNPCLGQPKAEFDTFTRKYSAGTGDWQTWDVTLPDSEPTNPGFEASPEGGYPLLHGQSYELRFSMKEEDTFSSDEDMGSRILTLTEANGWGIEKGANRTHYHLKAVHEAGGWGDYELDFDIERAATDLVPTGIRVGTPETTDRGTFASVCMGIHNDGLMSVGPFHVDLRIDGVTLHKAESAGLLAGESTERCTYVQVPTSGQHRFEAVIDAEHQIFDYDETNNILEVPYAPTSQKVGSSAQPTTSPGAAQPDLTVGAIKVNGRAPDGKDDCKDGKSTVTVVVKNTGLVKAKSFAMRLTVDGDKAGEEAIEALDAGQEREVRFEDVRLKKGEHQITASVAGKDTSSDARMDNNQSSVTVRCQDAS